MIEKGEVLASLLRSSGAPTGRDHDGIINKIMETICVVVKG